MALKIFIGIACFFSPLFLVAQNEPSKLTYPGAVDETPLTVERLKEVIDKTDLQRAGVINLDGDENPPAQEPEDDHG